MSTRHAIRPMPGDWISTAMAPAGGICTAKISNTDLGAFSGPTPLSARARAILAALRQEADHA